MPEPLIALESVSRSFTTAGHRFSVVEDVSLAISAGEVICLVGESGCGKTTTGKLLAGLLAPSTGRVLYRGRDIRSLRGGERRAYRLGVQLIHQDPFASLNPTQRIADILSAPLRRHRLARDESERRARLLALMELVELTPPEDLLDKFPHQLSGGQRQRVAIAQTLTVQPSFIVADEAVSMVDVSIRVSILDTLRRLRDEMGLGVLLITHDLALARYFTGDGRIGVMYLGRLVELGRAHELIERPRHPYTEALLAAAPLDPRHDGASAAPAVRLRSSEVPSVLSRPAGCPFHPRCPRFEPGLCEASVPELTRLAAGVEVACHPVLREDRAARRPDAIRPAVAPPAAAAPEGLPMA